MISRRADVVVATTAAGLVAAAVVTRVLTDYRVAWWVAGLVAGGYAWVVLRYVILRVFGVWRLGRGKTPVRWAIAWVVTLCVDWAGTWVAAALGGVLAAGYPLDASGPLVVPVLRTLPWSTAVVGGLALAAVLVGLALRSGPTGSGAASLK